MNQETRRDLLIKKTEVKKSRASVPLTQTSEEKKTQIDCQS
jgi:hypothetical protein